MNNRLNTEDVASKKGMGKTEKPATGKSCRRNLLRLIDPAAKTIVRMLLPHVKNEKTTVDAGESLYRVQPRAPQCLPA